VTGAFPRWGEWRRLWWGFHGHTSAESAWKSKKTFGILTGGRATARNASFYMRIRPSLYPRVTASVRVAAPSLPRMELT
jgi:hypothetical protein